MEQMKRQSIPVHRMDFQFSHGIEFSYMEMTDEFVEIMMKSDKNIVHRDDYYVFLLLETASAIFSVDFKEIELSEKSIYYIRPGQVHFVSSIKDAKGWFLAIDAMLIENSYKELFEGQFSTQIPIVLESAAIGKMREIAHLLHAVIQAKPTTFTNNIVLNLTNAFIGIIAEQYAQQQENLQYNKTRAVLISQQFKKLLSENFKTIKSPSGYAKMLNYSLSHLNESVKNVTNFPVSYWIHQQIVLEAKRLLFYTNLDIKEIAFKLGYEDYAYFSRLFSKIVGLSPSMFRNKFRE
jgi:AraC-like DNA-binding protein